MSVVVNKELAHKRAKLAGLQRRRPADDPGVIDAKRELRGATLAHHVEKVVAEWPPLTGEQLDRVASLLKGGDRA